MEALVAGLPPVPAWVLVGVVGVVVLVAVAVMGAARWWLWRWVTRRAYTRELGSPGAIDVPARAVFRTWREGWRGLARRDGVVLLVVYVATAALQLWVVSGPHAWQVAAVVGVVAFVARGLAGVPLYRAGFQAARVRARAGLVQAA